MPACAACAAGLQQCSVVAASRSSTGKAGMHMCTQPGTRSGCNTAVLLASTSAAACMCLHSITHPAPHPTHPPCPLLLLPPPLPPSTALRSSVPCQQRDWASNHKFECPNLRAAAVAAAAAAAAAGAALPVRPGAHGKPRPPPPGPDEDAPIPGQVLFPYDQYLALHQAGAASWRPPVGLVNLGNNCYANAALQCLLACQPLRAYLESGFHSGTCNRPSRAEWCLLCELQVLMWRPPCVAHSLPAPHQRW